MGLNDRASSRFSPTPPNDPPEEAHGTPGKRNSPHFHMVRLHHEAKYAVRCAARQAEWHTLRICHASTVAIQPVVHERSRNGELERGHEPPQEPGHGCQIELESSRDAHRASFEGCFKGRYQRPASRSRAELHGRPGQGLGSGERHGSNGLIIPIRINPVRCDVTGAEKRAAEKSAVWAANQRRLNCSPVSSRLVSRIRDPSVRVQPTGNDAMRKRSSASRASRWAIT